MGSDLADVRINYNRSWPLAVSLWDWFHFLLNVLFRVDIRENWNYKAHCWYMYTERQAFRGREWFWVIQSFLFQMYVSRFEFIKNKYFKIFFI